MNIDTRNIASSLKVLNIFNVEDGDIEEVVDALLDVIFQGIQANPDAGKLDMNAMLKFWKNT